MNRAGFIVSWARGCPLRGKDVRPDCRNVRPDLPGEPRLSTVLNLDENCRRTLRHKRVQSVDESGTELTLADGTKLLTPPGAKLNPGALEEGMMVIAMYREQDDGRKILTRLSRGQSAPVPEAPKRSQ